MKTIFFISLYPLLVSSFEVFTFLLEAKKEVWSRLDWNKVTTLCYAGWIDSNLTRLAHDHGAKVVFIANYPKDKLLNSTYRKYWIEKQISYATLNNLDGVNFDFEDELSAGSDESSAYTKLFKETVANFHHRINNSQVSIDVAWSPDNIDRRGYQYSDLAKYADKVFVMSYDEQSQMWQNERCKARANSPLLQTFTGIRKYLQLGVPAHKLILGVPWYGYRYPCQEFSSGVCYIESVPFRGCNCTDAAGREFAYKDILKMLEKSSDGRKWDENSKTPYFHYVDSNNTYQVWYDDPESLHIKYKIAWDMNLGGVGFWTGNFLDYSNASMIYDMWSIVP